MNRNRAGLLAIGVLIVAIAIVLVGGIFIRDEAPASRETAATAEGSRTPAATKQPDKAVGAAASPDTAGKSSSGETANAAPDAKGGTGQPAALNDTEPAKQSSDGMQTARQEPAAPSSNESAPAAERTAKPVVPAFDILRVEPDGSTVIAGRATPGAEVRIMNGDKVVTSTVTGEQGDFVAVLDEPLPPGDYELRLRSVGENGKAVDSEEVATVSVPEDRSGELLAMVTKPGEASRIITAPKPAGSAVAPAAKSGNAAEPSPAAPGKTTVANASPEAGAQAVTNEEARGSRPTDPNQVRVDAVEIEGESLYVAGAAPAGSTVRVYADDKLVGEAEASEEGRFVVDARMPLTVGDHNIRADLVDPATGEVVLRAAVPFTRPEGDQFAAVAPPGEARDAKTGAGASRPAEEGALSPELSRLRSEAEAALGDLQKKIEAATPSAEEIAKAREKAENSLSVLAGNPDVGAKGGRADAKLRQGAKDALTMLNAMPRISGEALPDVAAMKTMRSKLPDITASIRSAGEKPASTLAEAATDQNGPKTLVQPALTSSDDVVIIRRGDTLWQIARRVYGRGVRYTTIYLANNDQISNPDLILPGQIFDVPQKPLMNSEELHRERLQAERRN